MSWSILTDADVTANDTWYKILSPQKTVRVCQECYWPPKTLFKDILKRETTGRKFESPKRKSWNDAEILAWYKGIRTCPIEIHYDYPDYGFTISTTSLILDE
jgi:hypothetical protein